MKKKNILNEYQKIIIKSEPSLHLVTACEEKKLSTLSSSKDSLFIRDFKKLVTGLASNEKLINMINHRACEVMEESKAQASVFMAKFSILSGGWFNSYFF